MNLSRSDLLISPAVCGAPPTKGSCPHGRSLLSPRLSAVRSKVDAQHACCGWSPGLKSVENMNFSIRCSAVDLIFR